MKLTNNKVAEFVLTAFKTAYQDRKKDKLLKDNSFRSSYFVSLIGGKLKEHFQGAAVHYQHVDLISGNKESGEWLFDICVTAQKELRDTRHIDGKAKINTNILFACESEFGTSLSEFATDFGKLICSNANQYLYIQGLNQTTSKGRKDFIESRKDIIKKQLNNFIKDDFVLAFIPAPHKIKEKSFWDYDVDIPSWASIWIYSASDNDFIKYNENI